MANKINFGVGFSVDKSGLTQAVKELKEIQKISANDMFKIKGGDFKQVTSELMEAKKAAQVVEKAVQEAFNPRLNTVDFEKLNNSLRSAYGNVDTLKDKLSGAGASGVNAFNNIQNSLTTLNQKMKTSDSLLDKIGKTLGNTIRWNLSSSIVNQMSGSIQEAYGYVKHLDTALNDIRIVTNKSAEEMDVFAQKANTAAQALGKSTNDYTEAALLYYQSGLDGKEAEARTEVTLKAANVTQQSAAQVSEQLTAVWNGFQITAENTERSVDKLAAIAASTASDLEELSTGMSKVAAAANTMGVSEDQLASMLSTVISVTRGAPESIGVAFKTIFARVSDIQQGLSDEFASLGNYSGKMAQFGIEILDANGKMRDMGDIIEDIGGKWETLTKEQQLNLAQTMAGQRQYSNLIALFDNWDMYTKSMDTAANSAGTLQKQQDIYMESTAAHLEQMSAALENVYDSFLDTDTINNFADAVTNVANIFAGFIDSLGGGNAVLLNLGAVATRVFSEQIAGSLTKNIKNMQDMKNMANQSKVMFDFFKGDQSIFALENGLADNQKKLMAVKEQIQKASNAFSEEELNNIQNQIDGIQELINKNNEYSEAIERLNNLIDQSDDPEAKKLEYGEDYDNDYVKSIEVANKHLEGLQGKVKEIENNTKESFKNLSKGAEDFSDALKEMGIEDIKEGIEDQFKNLNEEIKILKESGEDLVSGDLIKFADEQKKKLEEVDQQYKNLKISQDEYRAELGKIAQAAMSKSSTVTKEIQKEIQANEQLKQKAAEVAAAQSELYDAQRILAEETQQQINLQNLNQSIVTVVGSIAQLGTSITSVISLFKIWNNENLSIGEKLGQTFSTAIIAVTQVITGFSALTKAVQSLRTNELVLDLALKLVNKSMKGKTAATLADITTTSAAGTVQLTFAGALKAVAAAAIEAGAALWALLGPFAPIIVAVTALTAGLAGIAWLNDAPRRELEALKQEAEEAKESARRLQEQIDKFSNFGEGYLEAVNSLDELVKGSDEYATALERANEQAEALLEIMPQLARYADFSGDFIKIDPDAIAAMAVYQQRAGAGADFSSIATQNKALIQEKENLNVGGLSAQNTKLLIEAIQESNAKTDQEMIKAIEDAGVKLAESVVLDNGSSATRYLDAESIFEKLGGKNQIENLISQYDSYQKVIETNNQQLIQTLAKTIEGYSEASKGDQAGILKAVNNSVNNGQYDQLLKDLTNSYKNYTDELLKSTFEQRGGTLSEEDKQKTTKEQNELMASYLANIDASTQLLQPIAQEIPQLRNGAIKENNKLDNITGINGLGQELIDFISGETDIQTIIPPEKREEIIAAIDELYKEGLSDNTQKLLDQYGEDAETVINNFKDKIANIDWTDSTNSFKQKLEETLSNSKFNLNADDVFKDLYNSLGKNQEKFSEIMNEFNKLDFNNAEVARTVKSLSDQLHDEAISAEEYASKLKELNAAAELASMDFEKMAESLGLDKNASEDIKLLAEDLMETAKTADDLSDTLAEDADAVADLAKEITRMNKGIQTLGKNLEGWIEALENGGIEGKKAFNEISDAVSDLLDVQSGTFSNDFIANNLDLIKQAAEGSAEAIEELRSKLNEDIILHLATNAPEIANELYALDNEVQRLALEIPDIEIGAYLNNDDFTKAANELVQTAGMSSDQANAYFKSIGYEPLVQKQEVPMTSQLPAAAGNFEPVDMGSFDTQVTIGDLLTIPVTIPKIGYTLGTASTSTDPVKGSMEYTTISGDEKAPQIANFRKTATPTAPSIRPNLSSGKKPSSGGGKGGSGKKPSPGKGKGGGGGSGTAKEAKQKDLIEDELDRYHDIDIEIQNIDRDLDRLGDAQKKLVGKDIIDSLNKQLDILNKQVDAYERKIAIAKGELAENRATLQQMGVTFDAEGQISNYSEAYLAALKKYNDAITAYNLMSAEEQEANGEAAIKAAEKEYEKFKEAISRYDELINDVIPDLQDSIQATIDKQIEIEIEKFKMEVEVRLDMADAERSWNEFKRKVINGIKDDDYLGIIKSQYADLLTYFNTADTGKGPIQALTEQLNGTLDQLKAMDGTLGDWATAYGNNQAQALEDLQEYLNKLMDQMMDVEDLIKDIEKTYLDMIKSIKDAFGEQLDNYKLIDDIIEHNKNVIGLLYGDKAYEQMAHYYDKQEQNNLQQLDFLRQEAAFWKEKMDAEEQGSEAWKQYKENWEDALGNLNSKVEDSIKTLIDKYTNLIDDIFDKLNNKVSNGLGLDYVKDEWDLINKNADQYLDTINRAFETQKLQEKFNEALANTSGLKAQQQIKDLMDQQLGDLEQRDKLTQYDVERAEKMLDIELKKIALQDAQQNKSKMRLRRDAQGNYSYQFVSDEQKIADAQKELAAAQNELYNFDKDRYQNNLNQIYDTYNEFQEKLKELYANTALSDEERERQKTLLIQQYGELINGLTEQNAQIRLNLEKSAFTELAKMYNTNLDEFMAMTEEQRMALMEGLIPYWNSGIQQMVDTFAGEGGFIPTCTESFSQLEQATQDYVNSLNEIEAAAGINFDAIAQGYDKNIELAQELIVKNEELISQYDRELQAVQEVLSAVRDLAAAYASVKQNAIEASEAAMKYQQEEAKRKAEAAEEERKKQEAANKQQQQQQAASNSSGTKPNSGTPQTTTGKTGKAVSMSDVRIGAKFRYTGGIYYYTSTGAGPVGNRGPGGVVEVENIAPNAKYKVAVKSSNSAYGWLNVNQLEKLKSGGYTGNWSGSGLDNDGGRLALLHQKELVLNSTDTQNILDAVGVLRGLSDLLGARAITNLANTLKDIKTSFPLQNNKQEEILEQQVTITATFPNVKNSNEVEDAINNLINTAAQRRNRRGR